MIMDGLSFADDFGNMIPIVSSTTISSSFGKYSTTSSEDKHNEHSTSSSCSTFVDIFRNKNESWYIHDHKRNNTCFDKISQSTPLCTWSSRGTSHVKETDTVSNISLLDYACVSSPMNHTCCTFVDKNPHLPTLEMFSSRETIFSKYTEETDTIGGCDCVSPIIIVAERCSLKSKQEHLTFPTMPDFSSSLTMASYTEFIDELNANDDDDDEEEEEDDDDDVCTFIESNKHMMKDDHDDDDGCEDDDCSFGASEVVDISRSFSLNHADSFTATERMHYCTPTTPTTIATTTTKTTTTMHATIQSPFHESISSNATKNSSYPTRTVSPKKEFKSLSSSLQHKQRLIRVMINTTSKTPQRHTTSNTANHLVNRNNNTTTNHNQNKKIVHGWNNMHHKNGCDLTTNNHNKTTMLQRYERSLFLLDDDGMMVNNNNHDEKTNKHPKHKLYYRQTAS